MPKPVFKVIFYNQNEIYEVYARDIYQSEMYGFVEMEELVFVFCPYAGNHSDR